MQDRFDVNIVNEIRKCGKCAESALKPVIRHMQIYNSVTTFECEHCGNKVEIIPLASTGMLGTVGLLVMAFWGVVLFRDGTHIGMLGTSLFTLAGLALLATLVSNLRPHVKNPIDGKGRLADDAQPDIMLNEAESHIAKSPLTWLENMGLIAGLVAPLLVIGLVLGLAAMIGYISFTYF